MFWLILIYSLVFIYLAWKKTDRAIYLILATLPGFLIRSSAFGVPFTLLEVMIVLLFLIFLLKNKLLWLKDFKKNIFFWPLICWLVISIVAVLVSPNLRAAAGIWKAYFLEPLFLFIIITQTINSRQQIFNIFWSLGVSAAYLSLIAIAQKLLLPTYQFLGPIPQAFLNSNGTVDRVVSILGYPNALGLYLGPIIILFTGFIFLENKNIFQQLLKFSIIMISFAAIILAKSEGAILAILMVWLILGLLYKKTRLFSLAAITAGIIIFFNNHVIQEFILTKIFLRDWSGFIRTLIWGETWNMLKDHWLWGAGLAGYQTVIIPYHAVHANDFEIYLYPHNIIFNFWSELGFFGLIVFLWLALTYLIKNLIILWQGKNKILSLTLIMVLVEILIHGLVDVPYFKNDLSILFWLFLALTALSYKIKINAV